MKIATKQQAINQLELLLQEFNNNISVFNGVIFNQPLETAWINLSKFNLYQDAGDADDVYMNIVTSVRNAEYKKIKIKTGDIKLSIKDKVLQYLLMQGNIEFMDDYNIKTFLREYKRNYVDFGTVPMRTVYTGKKTSTVEVIPFTRWISHPVDWTAMPTATVDRVFLSEILSDYNTAELEELVDKSKISDDTKVQVYTMEGLMANEDGEQTWQQHIIVEVPEDYTIETKEELGKLFVVDSLEIKPDPITVHYREKVENRTMGLSATEEVKYTQIVTNEIANLMMKQLRATAKTIFNTDDPELDGVDMSVIDDLTLIHNAKGTSINQLTAQPLAFGALQSYMQQWNTNKQDQTNAQDVVMSRAKSGVTLGATQLAQQESDSSYQEHIDNIAEQMEVFYKTFAIDIVIDYFKSDKAITDLLTDEQTEKFTAFLAEKLGHIADDEAVLSLQIPGEDSKTKAEELIKDMRLALLDDLEIDRADIKDKVRVSIANTDEDGQKKAQALQLLINFVSQAPDKFPQYNLKDLVEEFVSISSPDLLIDGRSVIQQNPQGNVSTNNQINNGEITQPNPQGV